MVDPALTTIADPTVVFTKDLQHRSVPLECIYVFRNVIISGNTRGALFPVPNVRDRFLPLPLPLFTGTSMDAKGRRGIPAVAILAYTRFFFFAVFAHSVIVVVSDKNRPYRAEFVVRNLMARNDTQFREDSFL